jgi:hypothetical protein
MYAWYPILDAGAADWGVQYAEGRDLGIERLRSLLLRHSSRFNTPPLQVKAIGRLTASWEGSIPGFGASIMEQVISRQDESPEAAGAVRARQALGQVLNAPRQRQRLVETLRLAVPAFVAPVYVGISDNLNRRLSEHVATLEKLYDAVIRDPSVRDRIPDTNFASRAIAAGFTPDTLEVWILDLETAFEEAETANELRILADAAEWLLNRWSRPLFGKR